MSTQEITVEGWPPPRGYANGRSGAGRAVHVGGQIGWNPNGVLVEGMVAQFALALDNVLAVVRAAGGAATDIADMTVYVTDLQAYRDARRALGPVWKERLGTHYPAMALVGVAGLVEAGAMVEIQATAYVESK